MESSKDSNPILARIKSHVPLIELVRIVDSDPRALAPASPTYGKYRKSGRDYTSVCPFHREKTPSFHVDDRENHGDERYKCFGGTCGAHGDHFRYIADRLKLSFPEAVEYIGERFREAGPLVSEFLSHSSRPAEKPLAEVKFDLYSPQRDLICQVLSFAQDYFQQQLAENSSPSANQARKYLESRGLDKIAASAGIGFSPENDILFSKLAKRFYKPGEDFFVMLRQAGLIGIEGFRIQNGRVTFPIKTMHRKIIGFTGRGLTEDAKPKYKNPSESLVFSKSHVLMGLEYVNKEHVTRDGLFLVKGITDIYGFTQQGFCSCLSIGSTTLTPEQLGLIRYLHPSRVFIMPDGDVPGTMGAIANANRMMSDLAPIGFNVDVKLARLPGKQDPFDVFFKGRARVRDYMERAVGPEKFILVNLQRLVEAHRENETTRRALESFLTNNTKHLIGSERLNQALKEYRIKIKGRQPLQITPTTPHDFLAF